MLNRNIVCCVSQYSLLFFICLIIMIPSYSIADNLNIQKFKDELRDDVIALQCVVTPPIWDLTGKPVIYLSNNLTRKVGSADFALGQYIQITGRILDSNCVPVGQAVVQIWQLDRDGNDVNAYYMTYNQLDKNLQITANNTNNDDKKGDKNFIGSGSTVTDNLGYYKFYTVYPGVDRVKNVPRVKFYIHHKDFYDIETQMFFPEYEKQNKLDAFIKNELFATDDYRLLIATKGVLSYDNDVNAYVRAYLFDITLYGKNKYREY